MHEIMKHRKTLHTVPLFREFLKNKCWFSAVDCYNLHTESSDPVRTVKKGQKRLNIIIAGDTSDLKPNWIQFSFLIPE